MSSPIVRRDFEVEHEEGLQPGSIEIFSPEYVAPEGDQRGHWKCRYSVDLGEFQHRFWMAGSDSYQALLMTMQIIPTVIKTSPIFRGGKLLCFGESVTSWNELFGFEPQGAV